MPRGHGRRELGRVTQHMVLGTRRQALGQASAVAGVLCGKRIAGQFRNVIQAPLRNEGQRHEPEQRTPVRGQQFPGGITANDVRQFVREHRLQLVRIQRVDCPCRQHDARKRRGDRARDGVELQQLGFGDSGLRREHGQITSQLVI